MKKVMQQEIDQYHGEFPELSLAPTQYFSEASLCRKRKSVEGEGEVPKMTQTSVDLQLKDPLPLDWEQCLDLQSGRMYYVNRKTLRKSWEWPKEQQQKLDLELNISSTTTTCHQFFSGSSNKPQAAGSIKQKQHQSYSSSSHNDDDDNNNNNNNMVALACLNCHLLVILSKSSPSCPNCKFLHSLPPQQQLPPPPPPEVKSLDTLSLLN